MIVSVSFSCKAGLLCFLAVSLLPLSAYGAESRSARTPPPSISTTQGAFSTLLTRTLKLSGGGARSLPVPGLRHDRLYSITVALNPNGIDGKATPNTAAALSVGMGMGEETLAGKDLHRGDPDLYMLVRPPRDGRGWLRIGPVQSGEVPAGSLLVKVVEWKVDAERVRNIAYRAGDSWKQATPIRLGETVFGSGDLTPYLPQKAEEITRYYDVTRKTDLLAAHTRTDGAEDWLTFEHREDAPKLAFFQIDLPERDNIPPDVSVYTEKSGRLVPYEEGEDPVAGPHEMQALPGNKFITRVLSKGRYYVRVLAHHPEWLLRTQVMDPPPYAAAPPAVQTGVDYLLGAGDSWHANTPRSGARFQRIANVHAETAQCIGCHPTQFSTRGALTARENGYQTLQRAALTFLTERMANNPRPFPGHPGANWARMISAPGNVSSRSADLVAIHAELLGEAIPAGVQEGAYSYLKLYYKGRTVLPDEESNGNQPLISPYEVVYHAWRIFDREHRRTRDPEAKAYADRLLTLLEQDKHKTLIDLSWQTVAMAKIAPDRYKEKIRANVERILSLQRPDGQWAVPFDPASAAVEFQTGHALYALAVAGVSRDHPKVKTSVEFLLRRQQPFGGWFDPLQSYENFRTPFRETQFAVMALSELYPAKPGQDSPSPAASDRDAGTLAVLNAADPVALLKALDGLNGRIPPQAMRRVLTHLKSEEPLVRTAAALALSRVGGESAVMPLVVALGDPVKGVQRSSALALRRLGNQGIGIDLIGAALRSDNPRRRWGATRIFAAHFRTMTAHPELAAALMERTSDPSLPIRIAALQSLWQWYVWTGDERTQDRILDRVLAKLAEAEHPWVTRNAREALYNIADENIRYLYNNWIPALADPADRQAAIKGQEARDVQIARKLAVALESGNSRQREEVLRGLGEFHLRNVYQKEARYNRIGNDIEQIRFSRPAAELLEGPLRSAMNDPSPTIRRHAVLAAFTVRDSGLLPVADTLYDRLADPNPGVRGTAKDIARAFPLKPSESDMGASAVKAARLLKSPHPEAHEAALAWAKSNPALRARILEAVKTQDPSERRVVEARLNGTEVQPDRPKETVSELPKPAPAKPAPGGVVRSPDYDFFARNVMPIFARKSPQDGNACVSCHFNHNLFRVSPPDASGRFTEEQVRETYRSALKMVNLKEPEKSLLLLKPLSSSATEGVVGAKAVAHGGGQRWPNREHPDFQALLAWIRGEKEETPAR